MKILITGSCGFIGFHLAKSLLQKNVNIIGVDNINNYYSTELKNRRLSQLKKFKKFKFFKFNLKDTKKVNNVFAKFNFDYVFHLAAQAGVRYSIENPREYISSNINGYYNIL